MAHGMENDQTSVREEKTCTNRKMHGKDIPDFLREIPAVEAPREEKTTPIFPVDEQNNSKDANYSAWVLSNRGAPENVCVRLNRPEPVREKPTDQNRGESVN